MNRPRDASPKCFLPDTLAKRINPNLEKARDRYLQESKAEL